MTGIAAEGTYATTDPIERVRAFYAKNDPHHIDNDELRQDNDVLSFHVKGTRYPTCEGKPTDAEQTVFIVSHATSM